MTLPKILYKWKQNSGINFFLYLDSVFRNNHKLVHNQATVINSRPLKTSLSVGIQ